MAELYSMAYNLAARRANIPKYRSTWRARFAYRSAGFSSGCCHRRSIYCLRI